MITRDQERQILQQLGARFDSVSMRTDSGEIYVLQRNEDCGWRYLGHIDNPRILEAR